MPSSSSSSSFSSQIPGVSSEAASDFALPEQNLDYVGCSRNDSSASDMTEMTTDNDNQSGRPPLSKENSQTSTSSSKGSRGSRRRRKKMAAATDAEWLSSRSSIMSPVAAGSRAAAMGTFRAASFAVSTASTASSSVAKGSVTASRSLARGSVAATTALAKGSRAVGTSIAKVAKDSNVDKVIREKGQQTMKTAQSIGTHAVTSASAVVPLLLSRASGSPRDAGFVVFSSLYATQAALQMVHHPRPCSMKVQEAPNPDDIFWRNVGLPARARRTGLILSVSATTVLCIFWSIPTAAISSLTEVNSLKQMLPGLADFLKAHPAWESLLALIAPMLLLFINEVILPWILK